MTHEGVLIQARDDIALWAALEAVPHIKRDMEAMEAKLDALIAAVPDVGGFVKEKYINDVQDFGAGNKITIYSEDLLVLLNGSALIHTATRENEDG